MTLDERLEHVLRVTPRQGAALRKLGIMSVRDLLFHFPARYEETGAPKQIRDLVEGERATVVAEVVGIKAEKTWKRKMRIAEGVVRDETGLLNVVWFNQPYVANILKPGVRVRFSGKVSRVKSGIVMANPLFEPTSQINGDPDGSGTQIYADRSGLLPIYPETYGLSSRWFRYQIQRILRDVGPLQDALPREILETYHLPSFERALNAVHAPKSRGEAEASRKRFSFEEIFFIQLSRQRERKKLEQERAIRIEPGTELVKNFVSSLPFQLTNAQRKAVWQILQDFAKPHPMARLLEGDVGSGKTVVAAAVALNAASAGYQVAYMAPTEILARQHFEEFIKRLSQFKVRIGLLTSSEARKFPSKVNPKSHTHISKSQLLKWCLNGEIQILIGTHALIEDRVKFKKLALVVVDEQHRFGVIQRRAAAKGLRPHFLSMSATPIPRTLALTIYGDLDLTVLDEMPPGREPVETRVISPREREKTYEFIREEVTRGGQVFVICPRIEDPKAAKAANALGEPLRPLSPLRQYQLSEWDDVKSVKAEYKKLSEEIFPDL
ncbi:MAG: DEAD/DEAH box helicase, partial [Patescibacteria group bacterium]